jgi:hypothetical protein
VTIRTRYPFAHWPEIVDAAPVNLDRPIDAPRLPRPDAETGEPWIVLVGIVIGVALWLLSCVGLATVIRWIGGF